MDSNPRDGPEWLCHVSLLQHGHQPPIACRSSSPRRPKFRAGLVVRATLDKKLVRRAGTELYDRIRCVDHGEHANVIAEMRFGRVGAPPASFLVAGSPTCRLMGLSRG